MHHPFQCIATIRPPHNQSSGYLLAACGPKLYSIGLEDGGVVSQWSAAHTLDHSLATPPVSVDGERLAKKAKLDPHTAPPTKLIKFTVSPNNQYAVAVTDDKSVRVFTVDEHGRLTLLSTRCMPKRPCAVQVLPDNATILCGDKFGDVYSLPLLSQPEIEGRNEPSIPTDDQSSEHSHPPEPRHFKPSATTTTVHTQRNLKTLAAQQSQRAVAAKSREPLKFEHKLLLGHVSVLTDLAHATLDVDGRQRSYILTADRDEHIRVSRAPPQSHVIEGYCLGHREFVSRLCLIPDTGLLLSGGGDGRIGVWKWVNFRLRCWLSLRKVFGEGTLAVSVIKILSSGAGDCAVIACEKSSKLALMPVSELAGDGREDTWCSMAFESPILDVVSIGESVLVSFDARKEGTARIQAYKLQVVKSLGWQLIPDQQVNYRLEKANALTNGTAHSDELEDLLYGVERLRKRGNQEEVVEDG